VTARALKNEHLDLFIVAEWESTVMGTVALEVHGDTGRLTSAAVAPAFQGRGTGVLLHDAATERARALGLRRLVLLTTTAVCMERDI
jgi:N-acetylglutamate synthase-like GNAT family acetyltransferase